MRRINLSVALSFAVAEGGIGSCARAVGKNKNAASEIAMIINAKKVVLDLVKRICLEDARKGLCYNPYFPLSHSKKDFAALGALAAATSRAVTIN